ncbi:hypothetical protein Q6294_31365, partial [Klebsiella pneumoniae]|nr:hypothetical protein [Klebsiella pneumoniae]
ERLKAAATSIDRTPHWLIKQAIFNYLEKLEGGATLNELNGLSTKDADQTVVKPMLDAEIGKAGGVHPPSVWRRCTLSAGGRQALSI